MKNISKIAYEILKVAKKDQFTEAETKGLQYKGYGIYIDQNNKNFIWDGDNFVDYNDHPNTDAIYEKIFGKPRKEIGSRQHHITDDLKRKGLVQTPNFAEIAESLGLGIKTTHWNMKWILIFVDTDAKKKFNKIVRLIKEADEHKRRKEYQELGAEGQVVSDYFNPKKNPGYFQHR